MRADPHDDMLLTVRPTTVVTEATRLLEDFPDPYGPSAQEEALFSGIGADPVNAPVTVAPSAAVAAGAAPTSKLPTIATVGIFLGAFWLISKLAK